MVVIITPYGSAAGVVHYDTGPGEDSFLFHRLGFPEVRKNKYLALKTNSFRKKLVAIVEKKLPVVCIRITV